MRHGKDLIFKSLPICIILILFSSYLIAPLFAFERVQRNGNQWIRYTTSGTSGNAADELGSLLLQSLKDEGCFTCHSDLYPDLAYDPDDPDAPNCSCFTSLKNGRWFPVDYFSLIYDPTRKPGLDSPSSTYQENYTSRKKGHLNHLVYQPFGLGRQCLDCHDPSRYDPNNINIPNVEKNGHTTKGPDGERYVYFKDGKTLKQTLVCTECHGGFYPQGSLAEDPNIASRGIENRNSLNALIWGDPSTVTCLQCHDNSRENGGIYASYISRYSTQIENDYTFYHDWNYEECILTAPDPDTVSGQNYWAVNGHGVQFNASYPGATLDTGYPDPDHPSKVSPNRGATNNQNIPTTDKKHEQAHDLNLDPNDEHKNFCWECHWSNGTVKKLLCVESYDHPAGLPLGKYNGHLDTINYRDERWGDPTEMSTAPHHQWKECRECHPSKYSHFGYKKGVSRRMTVVTPRDSHCIVCHNPHGSGSDNGTPNLFMIKGRIYKENCNNCHFSQFTQASRSPYTSNDTLRNLLADYSKTWTVDFSNPLKEDLREEISFVNSPTIPSNTSDICEVCHQDKEKITWTKPGGNGDPHQNGARHYFNPQGNLEPDKRIIDYRNSDCTGCHIHDPDPPLPLPPHTPDEQQKLDDTIGLFPYNSKAFAPTCRCHGIGKINIATLTYEAYRSPGNKPPIAGKGHGTPPPPLPNGLMGKDPHKAHEAYNFPCRECHINPEQILNLSYDPNQEYIFPLDGNTPVGFDPTHNPYGNYNKTTKTCTTLDCHSNGKGVYTSITWTESAMFCRDPLNLNCFVCSNPQDPNCCVCRNHLDPNCNCRFNYCNKCHHTPPDITGTDHSQCAASCAACHPHNGLYEQDPGFYKHVDGHVDVLTMDKIVNSFEPEGCGCCHSQNLAFHNPSPSLPLTQQFPSGSCLECHSPEHKKFVLCTSPQNSIDARCLQCHQTIIIDPPGCEANKQWKHSANKNCTRCHTQVCGIINDPSFPDYGHYDYYEKKGDHLPLAFTQDWSEDTGCGACHQEKYLTSADEKIKFRKSKIYHENYKKSAPSSKCSDCHGRHCSLSDISGITCTGCHTPDTDTKVGSVYLHNKFKLGEGLNCQDCHSSTHKTGSMPYAEGTTQDELEKKCKACHISANLGRITVSCKSGRYNHQTRAYCLNCHDVFKVENTLYKIEKKHYTLSTKIGKIEQSWINRDYSAENHCGVCHGEDQKSPLNPSMRIHDTINSPCNTCHGTHCDMNILPAWTGEGSCGGCHRNGDIILPNGQPLHAGIPSGVSCTECHQDHRSASSLHGYLQDSQKCRYCHGNPPAINVRCNNVEVNGVHPPELTNCQTCHPGVYSSSEHYRNPGQLNVIQSWTGTNSCGVCHKDQLVSPCPGGPPTIHAALGQASDCKQCHNNHCDMNYGDTPGKCITCHGTNPTICDICGAGSISTHYAFDTMGVNRAQIQNCLACHADPLRGGGEANPLEHINNPQTFVKEGVCLGCHSLTRVKHGLANTSPGCYACHPMHCTTQYTRNEACVWCHTTNPPIVDICQSGMGVTTHMALDSSIFNQIKVTNCVGCHVDPLTGGEGNPLNHINDPMTYVNPLTCMGCHSVIIPHGMSGLPWEGKLWPLVNCYSCHPKHCFSTFCTNPACIWCHTDAPLLKNTCGVPSAIPHTGNCVACHTGGVPALGECNPADHFNSIPYVREGTCLGCHSSVVNTHGPGTQACMLCHPVHCSFTYCSELQCKMCHTKPEFPIASDYGCGTGIHKAPAYTQCNRCHIGECGPLNHTLGPANLGMPTDVSGMRLDWSDCGLCHVEAQIVHNPCSAPCNLCHKGTSKHACGSLDYCADNRCKCCHASSSFPINSDYGCGTGLHAPEAYQRCTLCHANECSSLIHIDGKTDVSNMPLDWATCGLCHKQAKVDHTSCNQPCTACHSGTGNHACLDLNYCSESQCKCCHNNPEFQIKSDYECGIGPHAAAAYINCTLCHAHECDPTEHKNATTDISNMPLDWATCGLCHSQAQAVHVNCTQPCTACHSGIGNHSCRELHYCTETQCKCCHVSPTFNITSDYGCQPGTHPAVAYIDCTICHRGECAPVNHIDTKTDIENMPQNWTTCGLCHTSAQAIHTTCSQPCTLCHTGTGNHPCQVLDYCAEAKCKCCHTSPTFPITSDFGCGTGTHAATAYVDCTLCHRGECTPANHIDNPITDVSNMPIDLATCGVCHPNAQTSHANCTQPCANCHSGTSNHLCVVDYCADQQCRCCHVNVNPTLNLPSDLALTHDTTKCDCSTCHSAECAPLEHDITGVSTSHPMNTLYYNYTGTSANVGCTCCHGYPPQAKCVGISATQDHCLDLVNGCSPEIYNCAPCHILFNGLPTHIYTVYSPTSVVTASCACHGTSLTTTGPHAKHFTTPVMVPVYPGTTNVIDCKACHSTTTDFAGHVVCNPATVTAPVVFDATLPMIGLIDSYTPGGTPGTGSCNLYCHSDGEVNPIDVVGTTYTYYLGAPPYWNQTTGIVSCGNAILGTTTFTIYQCHGYPPTFTHPGGGGGGGGGAQNCIVCHPTPILGAAPSSTVHINGIVNITPGGPGGGGGGGVPGVGGGIPII